MPAERAGYTVTMFIVDVSKSMGRTRTIELPDGPDGEPRTAEVTNLEWALQFVKLKVQEMIYNGRKTDQCGVIIFGCEKTDNIANDKSQHNDYEHVSEYIRISQPSTATLAKLDALQPEDFHGDPVDAIIAAVETQAEHLASKKSWTRKVVLVTDGENKMELEDWEATAEKMNALGVIFTVVGIDFDDEEYGYVEENKPGDKRANEKFYHDFIEKLDNGVIGTYAFALEEIAKPDIKQTKSTLMSHTLRLGDIDTRGDEAFELVIKTSKCTALGRPKSWKKYGKVEPDPNQAQPAYLANKTAYGSLKMRSEYFVDPNADPDANPDDVMLMVSAKEEEDEEENLDPEEVDRRAFEKMQKVEKETLIKGFKYGTSYAPCPDGQFERLPTKKGIEICGFFPTINFPRHLSMGEIQYVWADPASPGGQVALSSMVQAMEKLKIINKQDEVTSTGVCAIARWVTKDGMDPKIGVLKPCLFDGVHCLLWAQMPFADDVRRYTFASLDSLVSKKGEEITEHPYIPTEEQQSAMDDFVDAMDLMQAGEKDEEGNRTPWFDTLYSYNPAVHRIKQALFHSAVVSDLETHPLPSPHPELTKYFDPPKKVVKKAQPGIEKCKEVLKVREVPKRVVKARKEENTHAMDDDEDLLVTSRPPVASSSKMDIDTQSSQVTPGRSRVSRPAPGDDSETEDEDDAETEDVDLLQKPNGKNPLPTPARSLPGSSTAAVLDVEVDMEGDGDIVMDGPLEPGRIISSTHPLRDFQKNLETGDVVTKAVEDLSTVISEIVLRPFASRRTAEMLECMKILRETALKEDEIEAWNAFLPDLKEKCLQATPGNREFWGELQKIGRDISLISNKEAKRHGGTASCSEGKAEKFMDT